MTGLLAARLRLPSVPEVRSRLLAGLGVYPRFAVADDWLVADLPAPVVEFLRHAYPDVRISIGSAAGSGDWEKPGPGGYHCHQSLESDLRALAAASNGHAAVRSIGSSGEGRELWALHFEPPDAARKRLLLVGCHHGCEWISVEVPFRIAEKFVHDLTSAGSLSTLLQGVEIWIVPMLNPDGHAHSVICQRDWRKNRTRFKTEHGEQFGVDLNRNYPAAWGRGDSGFSPAENNFRGPSPLSERETAAIQGLFQSCRFDAMISYHSFSQEILFPWAHRENAVNTHPTADLESLAKDMAAASAAAHAIYAAKPAWKHYNRDVGGEICDWAFREYDCAALTVELPPLSEDPGFRLPSAEIPAVIQGHFPALHVFLSAVLS